MSELVERVENTIFRRTFTGEGSVKKQAARAAIAEVFAWLAEPSDAAMDAVSPMPEHWKDRTDDPLYPQMQAAVVVGSLVAAQHYQTMLAQMRREALGDET